VTPYSTTATLQNDLKEVRAISVFGELFGGIYPHPDGMAL